MSRRLAWLLKVQAGVWLCALAAAAPELDSAAAGRSDLQFTQAPYSTPEEIIRRLGFREAAPEYELAREKFQMVLPGTYTSNSAWGLLVWISPGTNAWARSDWEAELAKHRILFVGACNSGNNRNPIDRFRLALDATDQMTRRFNIDRRRIYVGGFSGGARIASILGVAYADIFSGSLCVCGVNFYKNVPAAGGKFYPATYVPEPDMVTRAKKDGRFVLLTGEKDMNRQSTRDNWEGGFKPNGFQHVLCLDVKGMKHELPGPAVLNTALNYLEGIAPQPPGTSLPAPE